MLTLSLTSAATAGAQGVVHEEQEPAITAPIVPLSFSRTAVTTIAAPPTPDQKIVLAVQSRKNVPEATRRLLSQPLTVLTPTSPFGPRPHPIGGGADFHTGQDFAAPCGTDVHATAGGKVTESGWHKYGGGNRVVIEHTDGLKTTYNHLESAAVKRGQKVNRGSNIGGVGSTGASTGCHLHFEVFLQGKAVDPADWL